MIFLILKAYGAVSALEMMALSTPSSEIISVLRKAHVPKIFVEMMSMIYRYIFLLFDVHSNMRNSAKSRLGYCNLKTSYYTFGSIISNMLVVSLKKANASYDAMEARCYDGEIKFLEEDKELSRVHVAAGALFCISLILIRILTV
jgi:cobalt/nickel transport system permease protein